MIESADTVLARAQAALAAGNPALARQICDAALAGQPATDALKLRASLLLRAGDTEGAIADFRSWLQIHPDDTMALGNLGPLLCARGEMQQAVSVLERAVALEPGSAPLRANLGGALALAGRPADAVRAYESALALEPRYALAHERLGATHEALGAAEQALAAYRTALSLDPRRKFAQLGLARILLARGDVAAALVPLEAAIGLDPADVDLRGDLVRGLIQCGDNRRAIEQLREALALDPAREDLWLALGQAWSNLGHRPNAISAYRHGCRRLPDSHRLHAAIANLLRADRQNAEALAHARRAEALAPDAPEAVTALILARQAACDWEDWDPGVALLRRTVETHGEFVHPSTLLTLTDDPTLSRRNAEAYAARLYPGPRRAPPPPDPASDRVLRVAYISSDLGPHPVGLSLAELLERHDREAVRVIGVSLRPQPDDTTTRRLRAACDEFVDAGALSDGELTARLRDLDLDVAVDLNGYTDGARPQLYAAGIARIQAGFLGYPGTLGGGLLDYLVADGIVIPPAHDPHYTERIARLPVCFFPSDSRQRVSEIPARSAAGLPEDAFVFAGLTQTTRLLPETFAVWMQLLEETPRSVLWLAAPAEVEAMLRGSASRHGVDPGRLVFTSRIADRAAYLGRLAMADLYLDVYPYGGHSTVRDAMWAGLPVLTRSGDGFPSRVAASLLSSAGLDDWIAPDWSGYLMRARRAVAEPVRLLQARAALRDWRQGAPARTIRLARELEAAYRQMTAAPAAVHAGAVQPA